MMSEKKKDLMLVFLIVLTGAFCYILLYPGHAHDYRTVESIVEGKTITIYTYYSRCEGCGEIEELGEEDAFIGLQVSTPEAVAERVHAEARVRAYELMIKEMPYLWP